MHGAYYLAAKAFVDRVKPQTLKNKKLTKDGTAFVKDADDNNNDVDDDNDDWILDWN